MKNPEFLSEKNESEKREKSLPTRRDFLKGAGAAFALGSLAKEDKLHFFEWVDDNLEKNFELQREWMLEYITSPKYRERIKRSLARGFFNKNKKDITPRELKRLKEYKLEGLYPTNIDTSKVSEQLVDVIIKKRIENVKNAKMKIVNNIDSTNAGAYFTPAQQKYFSINFYPEDVALGLNEGKNIFLSRITLMLFPETTVPVHELSHASTEADNDIEPKLKTMAENLVGLNYYNMATEIKARLDALRFELEKLGIYNPKTEDFNKKHLDIIRKNEKLKNSPAFWELIQNVDQDHGDDLIWYMNNIADVGNIGSVEKEDLVAFLGRDVAEYEV